MTGPSGSSRPDAVQRGDMTGGILPERIEVTGIDPILHSRVGEDPRHREQIDFWVGFWSSRGSAHFGRYLDRMAMYEHLVDLELERRELPRSLRYLPIVESGYLPNAISRVGATGLWQIMPPTARSLGLSVNTLVDDRRDPVAATTAALDYLEALHRQFGSWFLALAAYNAGPGRITTILNRYAPDVGLSGDERFLLVREHLPAETREFVPKLFAAAALAGNPERYGVAGLQPLAALAFDVVQVPDATSLDVVARAAEVDEEDVLALNPHFLRGFTPVGEEREVRVPVGGGVRFDANYPLIPPGERVSFLEHVVVSGETLSHISRRYGVSVAEISAANGNLDPRRLQVGARLVVPIAGRGPPRAAGASVGETTAGRATGSATSEPRDLERSSGGNSGLVSNAPNAPSARTHRVTSGETWGGIANRYGVGTEVLARANGRTVRDIIRIGEALRIP